MATPGQAYFDLGIPALPATNDPKNIEDIQNIYVGLRNLAIQVSQLGGYFTPFEGSQVTSKAAETIGPAKRRVYVTASVAITYGQLVNLWNNAGVLNARIANAAAAGPPLEAHGICNTVGTCAIGATIEVVVGQAHITSIGGLVRGTTYYLSNAVPGAVQAARPAVVGDYIQAVGFAIAPSEMFFNLSSQFQIV